MIIYTIKYKIIVVVLMITNSNNNFIEYVLFFTIICIIFTLLCKKLVKRRVFSRSFRCHVHHFQCLTVLFPPGKLK